MYYICSFFTGRRIKIFKSLIYNIYFLNDSYSTNYKRITNFIIAVKEKNRRNINNIFQLRFQFYFLISSRINVASVESA